MPLSTNNNIMAMNVRRSLNKTQVSHDRELEKVGSGLRVMRAENDAAGVSISEGLRSELTKLGQNVRNAEQASDLLRVAEGSLGEASTILQRMRTLAMQASNGDLNDRQREVLAAEYDQASAAIDRIAQATVYNDRVLLAGFAEVDEANTTILTDKANTGVAAVTLSGADEGTYTFIDDGSSSTITLGNGIATQTLGIGRLLDGTEVAAGTKVIANFDRLGVELTLAGDGAIKPPGVGSYAVGDLDGHTLVVEDAEGGLFQVGPSAEDNDQLRFDLPDLRASGNTLDLDRVSLASQRGARDALGKIDQAIGTVSGERGQIGALINRLGYTITFSGNEIENVTNSESTIRDADMARAASALARSELLQGTSNVMLRQAFATSRQVLQLL